MKQKRYPGLDMLGKKNNFSFFKKTTELAINEYHQQGLSRELEHKKQNNTQIVQLIYHCMKGTWEQLENCLDLDYDFDFDVFNSQLHNFTTVTVYYRDSVLYMDVS